MCSSWSRRKTLLLQIYFSRKNFCHKSLRITFLFSICTFKWEMHCPQLLVFPRNKIFQKKTFSVCLPIDLKMLSSCWHQKLNHSWFQREPNKQFIQLSQMFKPEQKTPSNAVANFESTRLKPDFSQTLSLPTQFKRWCV